MSYRKTLRCQNDSRQTILIFHVQLQLHWTGFLHPFRKFAFHMHESLRSDGIGKPTEIARNSVSLSCNKVSTVPNTIRLQGSIAMILYLYLEAIQPQCYLKSAINRQSSNDELPGKNVAFSNPNSSLQRLSSGSSSTVAWAFYFILAAVICVGSSFRPARNSPSQ